MTEPQIAMGQKPFDIVMLYSGGADSRLMLQFAMDAGKKVLAVLIDYGQKHFKELEYAKKQLNEIGIIYRQVNIQGLKVRSGLTDNLEAGRWDNVHPMNVPGRNTIFIGIAYSIAEDMGIDEIWYGPDYSDRVNLFPDCYQEYVVRMNSLLEISGVRPIKLVAPLLGWSKEMIIEYLWETLQIDATNDLYSGYEETGSLFNEEDTEL